MSHTVSDQKAKSDSPYTESTLTSLIQELVRKRAATNSLSQSSRKRAKIKPNLSQSSRSSFSSQLFEDEYEASPVEQLDRESLTDESDSKKKDQMSPLPGKCKYKRADCWNYFATKFCPETNSYYDYCTVEKHGQVCGAKFVHHGATTRLNKHLLQRHRIKIVKVNKAGDEDIIEESDLVDQVEHHKEPRPIKKSRSDVSSADEPSMSKVEFAFNANFEANKLDKNQESNDLNMLLISMILSSSNSFDLVENKWFRMFINMLNKTYKVPTSEELKRIIQSTDK